VAATPATDRDWAAALHLDGRLTLHAVKALFGAGVIPTTTELIDVAIISPQ
jgi:hypothetical protein